MIFKIANIDGLAEHIMAKFPHLIKIAKDWAKDCVWAESDTDPDNNFIDTIPPEKLLKLINRHYDGGLQAFYQNNKGIQF